MEEEEEEEEKEDDRDKGLNIREACSAVAVIGFQWRIWDWIRLESTEKSINEKGERDSLSMRCRANKSENSNQIPCSLAPFSVCTLQREREREGGEACESVGHKIWDFLVCLIILTEWGETKYGTLSSLAHKTKEVIS